MDVFLLHQKPVVLTDASKTSHAGMACAAEMQKI